MLLKSQLLVYQPKRASDLEGKVARCREPNTVQQDLGDEQSVGRNHRDLPKQGFEVVWQRCSPEMERVHRDEQPTVLVEGERCALDQNLLRVLVLGLR